MLGDAKAAKRPELSDAGGIDPSPKSGAAPANQAPSLDRHDA